MLSKTPPFRVLFGFEKGRNASVREMCHPCRNCGKCMRAYGADLCPVCGKHVDWKKGACPSCGFFPVTPPGQSMGRGADAR